MRCTRRTSGRSQHNGRADRRYENGAGQHAHTPPGYPVRQPGEHSRKGASTGTPVKLLTDKYAATGSVTNVSGPRWPRRHADLKATRNTPRRRPGRGGSPAFSSRRCSRGHGCAVRGSACGAPASPPVRSDRRRPARRGPRTEPRARELTRQKRPDQATSHRDIISVISGGDHRGADFDP